MIETNIIYGLMPRIGSKVKFLSAKVEGRGLLSRPLIWLYM